jgi:hypothetical protein
MAAATALFGLPLAQFPLSHALRFDDRISAARQREQRQQLWGMKQLEEEEDRRRTFLGMAQ